MGKQKDLKDSEMKKITHLLGLGRSTLEISKIIKRDHRTIKKYVYKGKTKRKDPKRGHLKKLKERDIRKIKTQVRKTPHLSSRSIFESAGIKNISKTLRCKALKTISKVKSPKKEPPLSEINKNKRLLWAETYKKIDFSKVLWTDECRVTLDGPDGWFKGWVLNDTPVKTKIRRQQGGGGIMIWAVIIDDQIVGPYRLPKVVKLTAVFYCQFLGKYLVPFLDLHGPEKENIICISAG